jgi:superfamily II DNA or RNA helicase/HKD family nuclease/SOS-response transcriptional repressor LexA
MDDILDSFSKSLQTGYIDKSIISDLAYQPELLVNQKNPPKKVLSTILQEFENCNQFFISVAFVTTSGIASIINKLKELEKKEIKGKILVSQYLNFTQPEALRRLLQFKNIDLRIATTGNAHSKGYIFMNDEHYNLIIGSSNLTAQALCTNKEWNIKVSALDKSGIVEKVIYEFNSDFEKGTKVTLDFILSYEAIYNNQLFQSKNLKIENLHKIKSNVNPNSMQLEALKNLKKLRAQGKNKALIISATGTGKTYLSAFDVHVFNPKRLLFVVHRLTIAKESLKTFKNVFGESKTMGLFSGNLKDLECDFIFSTIQTISKSIHLNNFPKDYFDYIIIDETHRTVADTYMRLIDHFEPKFLLGMTATPERTDNNDIFRIFDYNIAYEIRLSKAMEQEMLSSFHYFGISDLSINDRIIETKSEFRYLVAEERVNRIIEYAKFYGCDNGITRGLIFCSRKDEAIELSNLFNKKGLKTIALIGDNSEEERSNAIDKLENDNLLDKLDYIFTVDIFNEGIDIPKVNQIIMLRPTKSAIIFIQQLGRGLRKVEGKSYLTVIDFIGNYENSYLIPIALYGDTSYNKDSLRKLLTEGSRMIPGASTINFDEITKERIYQSIDSANMQLFADLKKDYNLLKFKIGRTPMMMDFILYGSRDPFLFVDYANSYYNFVLKVENNSQPSLSTQQIKLLELFSKEINNSKRIEECLILKFLIESSELSVKKLREFISLKYHYSISDNTIKSCISNLNFEFIREKKDGKLVSAREIYNIDVIELINGNFILSNTFKSHLNVAEFKHYLIDSIDYSIFEFDRLFEKENWQNGFVLYRKYSRKDVFRILNISENPVAQNVGGYLVSSDNSNCPIFVNYHKEDHISESTKYEDVFVNNKEFDWMTKSNRTINSNDVKSILGKNGPIRLPLFIKKNNDEGMEFYYMGEVIPNLNQVKQTTIPNDAGNLLSVVKIRFNMTNPVNPAMFVYLHENIKKNSRLSNSDVIANTQNKIHNVDKELNYQIPFYNFYAAAGTFSQLQSEKSFTFIDAPVNNSNNDYFACRIIGESMNRIIPNGSICLFKFYKGGSRNGKILLIENRDIQDLDFNSAFTIKTYSSEKIITEDHWEHVSIVLRPNSYDSSFQNIIITNENASEMRVIGEFVKILK